MASMRIRVALLALAIAVPAAAGAQDRDAALQACRAETDDAHRLACYDRVFPRPERQPEAAGRAPAAAPATPAAAPESTAEERFGRGGAMIREESDRKDKESRDLGELNATVTGIKTRSDGLMVITLDNGQVWTQNRPDSFFRLKTGDPIKIEPAALNSYLMSGPSKRSTRVSRLK
jgi:hypothetical protein